MLKIQKHQTKRLLLEKNNQAQGCTVLMLGLPPEVLALVSYLEIASQYRKSQHLEQVQIFVYLVLSDF